MSGRHEFQKHQRRALAYARVRDRIALFMEMRLGKSPVSIRWAKDDRLVLLVAPLSTLLGQLNWHGELVREGITPVMLPNVRRQDREQILRPASIRDGRFKRRWATGWFGVNFEAIRTQPEILDAPWDAIIVDESTRIRSHEQNGQTYPIYRLPNRETLILVSGYSVQMCARIIDTLSAKGVIPFPQAEGKATAGISAVSTTEGRPPPGVWGWRF